MVSFAEQGKIAAQLAAEVLDGRKPADIPIVDGPSLYVFDWKQLKRWNLDERRLPAGSIVLNREPTLWERAKWILLSGLAAILGLTALAGYLLYKQKQLNAAKHEQMRLSGMSINAQEDERRRLASELHDDFSQRLALLSLGLETAAEAIPDSSEEVNRQLQELSCLSWKWRERSSVKIAERTYEKGTKALHRRGEGGHSEAAPFGQGCGLGLV